MTARLIRGRWVEDGKRDDSLAERVRTATSNDEPAEVKTEMRAAELAQHIAEVTKRRSRFRTAEGRDVRWRHLEDVFNGAEIAGHITWQFNSAKQPEQDGEWAGYLAAAIVGHEEGES